LYKWARGVVTHQRDLTDLTSPLGYHSPGSFIQWFSKRMLPCLRRAWCAPSPSFLACWS
jgi:hypothetical protein